MDINKDNLENALNDNAVPAAPTAPAAPETPVQPQAPQMPKEVEIGFHQGALNTLVAERNELFKMIQNVEKVMGMHVQRLEQMGVKIEKKAPETKK